VEFKWSLYSIFSIVVFWSFYSFRLVEFIFWNARYLTLYLINLKKFYNRIIWTVCFSELYALKVKNRLAKIRNFLHWNFVNYSFNFNFENCNNSLASLYSMIHRAWTSMGNVQIIDFLSEVLLEFFRYY
jgi:hypothetical protein